MNKQTNFLSGLVAAAMIFGLAQTASAQSTASNDQGTANNLVTSQTSSAASSQVAGLVGTAVSNVVAPPGAPAPAAPTTTGFKSDSKVYFNSRQTGLAAGQNPKAGVWAQGGYTTIEGSDTGGEFDGDVVNFLVGFDYKIRPKMILGVAIGTEDLDLDTIFNNGTFEGRGYGVTPYFGMAINNNWSFQVLGGWTTVEYDTFNGNTGATSSFDADRYFGSASVVGNFKLTSKVVAAPKVSILHLAEHQDGTTDSAGNVTTGENIDLGRVSAGGTISYIAGSMVPYARLLAEYDYTREDAVNLGGGNFSSDDEYGLNAAIGLNMNFKNGWSGNVEGSTSSILRENLDVYTVTGRIRYQW